MHSWCVDVAVLQYMWHCSYHNTDVVETINGQTPVLAGNAHQWLLPHVHSLDQCYLQQTKEPTVTLNWWFIASCKLLERQASKLQLLSMSPHTDTWMYPACHQLKSPDVLNTPACNRYR